MLEIDVLMCWCVEPSSVQSILSISNRTYTILRPNANRTGKLNWLIQSDFYALFTDLLIEHSWFIAFRYPYKFYKLPSTFNKSLFARTNMLSALKLIFCFFSLLILSMYCHLNCCFVDFSPRKVMTNYYWCDSFFQFVFVSFYSTVQTTNPKAAKIPLMFAMNWTIKPITESTTTHDDKNDQSTKR